MYRISLQFEEIIFNDYLKIFYLFRIYFIKYLSVKCLINYSKISVENFNVQVSHGGLQPLYG